jgi:hypothetical protein
VKIDRNTLNHHSPKFPTASSKIPSWEGILLETVGLAQDSRRYNEQCVPKEFAPEIEAQYWNKAK